MKTLITLLLLSVPCLANNDFIDPSFSNVQVFSAESTKKILNLQFNIKEVHKNKVSYCSFDNKQILTFSSALGVLLGSLMAIEYRLLPITQYAYKYLSFLKKKWHLYQKRK
jgi:hypothetical protein